MGTKLYIFNSFKNLVLLLDQPCGLKQAVRNGLNPCPVKILLSRLIN